MCCSAQCHDFGCQTKPALPPEQPGRVGTGKLSVHLARPAILQEVLRNIVLRPVWHQTIGAVLAGAVCQLDVHTHDVRQTEGGEIAEPHKCQPHQAEQEQLATTCNYHHGHDSPHDFPPMPLLAALRVCQVVCYRQCVHAPIHTKFV